MSTLRDEGVEIEFSCLLMIDIGTGKSMRAPYGVGYDKIEELRGGRVEGCL
jgi:hypothetical protein